MLSFVFCVFAIWAGDFYHYHDILERMQDIDLRFLTGHEALERPYFYLASIVGYDYFLWRAGVWGLALIAIKILSDRLVSDSDRSRFFFFFIIYSIILFSYARVSLAFSLAFLGFSFIVKTPKEGKRKFLSIVIGILIVAASMTLHRSAKFLLIIFPVSLISLTKRNLRWIILILPLMFLAVDSVIQSVQGLLFAEGQTYDILKATRYLNGDRTVMTFGRRVQIALTYVFCYTYYAWLISQIFSPRFSHVPYYIRCFANASFWILTVAALIGLASHANTFVISYRFMYFSIVPAPIVLSYFYDYGRLYKLVLITCLVNAAYLLVAYKLIGTILYH